MQKRKFLALCASSLLATLSGNGQDAVPAPASGAVAPSRILIAYYSWGGNTKFVAEQIQKATGGTLFEIKPVTSYPKEYKKCTDEAKKQINEGFKPELATKVDTMDQYDIIFIGSPNWWSSLAPPVASFASGYDLSGKTIIPFVTHGGGGLARCESDLRKLCPKSTFRKSGVFSGNGIRSYRAAIAQWVKESVTIQQ